MSNLSKIVLCLNQFYCTYNREQDIIQTMIDWAIHERGFAVSFYTGEHLSIVASSRTSHMLLCRRSVPLLGEDLSFRFQIPVLRYPLPDDAIPELHLADLSPHRFPS